MRYIIVGGGPTGLSLAYALSKSNYDIILFEKSNQLGGSWNSQWIDNLYWSENSPRVLSYSGYTKKFLNDINITNNDVNYVYGNYFQTNKKVFLFLKQFFYLSDYIFVAFLFIIYRLVKSKKTLKEVLDESCVSSKAKKLLNIVSILICDRADKTNINDFMGTLSGGTFYQYKEPNKWHKNVEKILKKRNVKIFKNTEVVEILSNNTDIKSIITNDKNIYNCDKLVLCTQSSGLYNIFKNSNMFIRNNWLPWPKMKYWCNNTFYNGFGFQIHFYSEINYPNEWCWSCIGDWTVIILPVSNWLSKFSKDNKIKTVWSCCIVDLDTKSKRLNLSANQCQKKQQVIDECLYQINNISILPNNYKITTSQNLYRDEKKGKWISYNTGYTKYNLEDLPIKGYLNNLYALGTFTEKKKYHIANKETAILSTVNFLKKYEPKINSFHNKQNLTKKYLIFLVFIIVISIFYKTIFQYIIMN